MEINTIEDLKAGSEFHGEITNMIVCQGIITEEDVAPKGVADVAGAVDAVAKAPAKKARKPRKKSDKPLKGKIVVGKGQDFWTQHGLDVALDNSKFETAAARKGAYAYFKDFFATYWKDTKTFTLNELKEGVYSHLSVKGTPREEQVDGAGYIHGHRFQRVQWAVGSFYEGGAVALKPLTKKLSRGKYLNIFAEGVTSADLKG